jgi:hypothetical protein
MHNRKPDGIESREVGLVRGAVLTGLIACIVGLALWPGLILHRADDSVSSQLNSTAEAPTEVAQR